MLSCLYKYKTGNKNVILLLEQIPKQSYIIWTKIFKLGNSAIVT